MVLFVFAAGDFGLGFKMVKITLLLHFKTTVIVGMYLFLFILSNSCAFAGSVRRVSMDEMIQQCQLVFEGKVLELEARENQYKRIHTVITFEVLEVVKGQYSQNKIELSFLGGTVGEVSLVVSDMMFPEVGEHGIYFVESLEKVLVNPLYGWSQGHFVIEPDTMGKSRVMTNRKKTIVDVRGNNDEQTQLKSFSSPQSVVSTDWVASGVTTAQAKTLDQAISPIAFKKALREMLSRGQ